ncbi:TPA: hypothetical protein DIC20_03105 [Candidatus Dependentiae bacterium]|nr:MAG: hypothetical protein US03_C0001G0011 [candidate division TM6 bacterium GW2011_GWF2_36_131]KKQ03853.1 MAG: hypothetical protein US13_C0001G0193 [candidate division TM6 bacterium GW2011_GWE2_36_25]KKQ19438.1 MAG: hypothetical protein US32_C0009G0010 [candidate division TM6 bacterium GW2011_GWA2_36_9]HBR70621.1 hypothetical protein [Candidatus Dependentiae bacterium]HCU00664.1 hypothetical protein [Candidatus Dependentiae bacterium]
MKFCVNKFAFSASLSMAFVYFLMALYTWFWPASSLKLSASYMLMSNLNMFAPLLDVSIMNVVSGLVQTFIFTYIWTFGFAWLYNRMEK